MFGVGIDTSDRTTVIAPTDLELLGGQIVMITGPSGGGKSCLLRVIERSVADREDVRVIDFGRMGELPDRPLVDCLDGVPLERLMGLLAVAGLNDAAVMLRRPCDLSDGQRYRLSMAQMLVAVESGGDDRLCIVLADEFASSLDRVTAQVVCRNVRKWVNGEGAMRRVCFVAASAHDDLLEALAPDVLVFKDLGSRMEVLTRANLEEPQRGTGPFFAADGRKMRQSPGSSR